MRPSRQERRRQRSGPRAPWMRIRRALRSGNCAPAR